LASFVTPLKRCIGFRIRPIETLGIFKSSELICLNPNEIFVSKVVALLPPRNRIVSRLEMLCYYNFNILLWDRRCQEEK
jgi:hypothetical protein